MRPPAALLAAASAVLVTLLPVAPGSAATAEVRYGKQAVRVSNHARVNHGLHELRTSRCLQRFAVRQAKVMAAEERMFHQDLGPVLAECSLSFAGENVAYGYPTGRSVVRDGWMQSEDHRANILSHRYRIVAVAGRRSADGVWYAAQVFGRKA